MLGIVHLWDEKEYADFHNIAVTILCELVGRRLAIPPDERVPLLCAALTANLGMQYLQAKLHGQTEPLSKDQKISILNHPERSVEFLQAAGVTEEDWLSAVLQHHERMDGKGYPRRLPADEVSREARLISLADMYTAMVSHRADRGALSPKEVLKEIFACKDQQYDNQIALVFIKELTIFPPGAFVRLANGDIAIVVKRKIDSMWPWVASLISPRGGTYEAPQRHDTAQEQYQVKEMVKRVPSIRLNLPFLWGYTNQT